MTDPLGIAASTPLLLGGMASSAPTDSLRTLTEKLARGDDAAWSQFHRDYGPAVFRQLLAATRGDHDLASEALQQTYLRVARHVRACDSAPMFESWLRVVARTALSDSRRRRQTWWKRLARDDGAWDFDAEANKESSDETLLAALDAAMRELSPADRTLLEAKYLSRRSVRDIAANASLPEKTIESRLTRARVALRERITALLARS